MGISVEPPEEEPYVQNEINLSEISSLSPKDEDDYQKHGGAPEELLSGIHLAEFYVKSDPINYRNINGAVNSIAKNNQLFSFSGSELCSYEIATLIKFLDEPSALKDAESLRIKAQLH